MKIGIAQINTTVGDLSGNLKIALESYHSLVGKGAELIVFPELTLCGYPPRDLLLKKYFAQECTNSLIEFAAATGSCPALVGYPEINHSQKGKPFFNSAGLCWNGEIKQVFRKRLLPTYDVFLADHLLAHFPGYTRWSWLHEVLLSHFVEPHLILTFFTNKLNPIVPLSQIN